LLGEHVAYYRIDADSADSWLKALESVSSESHLDT